MDKSSLYSDDLLLYVSDLLLYVSDPASSLPHILMEQFGKFLGYKLNLNNSELFSVNYVVQHCSFEFLLQNYT